jgi:ABC-type Fe3+-citrate transport system substrate-binding protein
MRYVVASATAVAVLALATIAGAQMVPVEKSSEQKVINAEVVMKDKAFHITQGESGKGIMLVAGSRASIRLRNEDSVAHEFVSTLLYNLPFQLAGNGTFVKASKAAGIRVDPGQTVVLSFEVPYDSKEFQDLYEVFWCNVHGKQHGDAMRGEILIIDQRGEVSGG